MFIALSLYIRLRLYLLLLLITKEIPHYDHYLVLNILRKEPKKLYVLLRVQCKSFNFQEIKQFRHSLETCPHFIALGYVQGTVWGVWIESGSLSSNYCVGFFFFFFPKHFVCEYHSFIILRPNSICNLISWNYIIDWDG